MTSPTQGPPALTSARARDDPRRAVRPPRSVTRQRAAVARGRRRRGCAVRISAPRAAASRALSTTRRASSTQQSEYSKPVVKRVLQRPARRVAASGRGCASAAGSCARRDGRRRRARAAAARPAAARRGAAARSAAARRCAAWRRAGSRARSAPRAPGGTRSTRGSAARRGTAWSRPRRSPARGRPARRAPTCRPAAGGVAGDAAAVDAAADHEEVEVVRACVGHVALLLAIGEPPRSAPADAQGQARARARTGTPGHAGPLEAQARAIPPFRRASARPASGPPADASRPPRGTPPFAPRRRVLHDTAKDASGDLAPSRAPRGLARAPARSQSAGSDTNRRPRRCSAP